MGNFIDDALIPSIFLVIFLIMLYMIAVVLPVSLFAEKECLSKGYPEARATVTLDRYCVKTFGQITEVKQI